MRFSRLLLPMAFAPLLAFAIELWAQSGASTFRVAQTSTFENKSAAPQNGSTIQAATNLVVVDVVVSDDGKPVKGLRPEAFRVFEDGREQTIKVFEEHNSADTAQTQKLPPLPPNTYSDFP